MRWFFYGIIIFEVYLLVIGNIIDISSSNICFGIYFYYFFCVFGSGDIYFIDFSVSVGVM